MNTELLALLEKDARLTPAQLATMLGRNEQSVTDEIAYCEKNHIILGYPALIDWTKTDDELVTALIEVRISPQRGDGFDRIAERIYHPPSGATASTASPSASTSMRRWRAST